MPLASSELRPVAGYSGEEIRRHNPPSSSERENRPAASDPRNLTASGMRRERLARGLERDPTPTATWIAVLPSVMVVLPSR
jgi:hypothetical protein